MTTRLPGFLATSRTCAPSQPQKTDPEDAAPTAAGPGDPAGLATEAANQAGPLSGESTPPARAIFRAAPPQLLDKAATPVPKAPPPGITPPVMFRSTAARRAKVEEAPAEPAPAKAPPKPASTRPRRAPRAATTIPAPPARPFRVVPLTRMAQGDRWRTEAMRSYSVALLLWFVRGQGRITIAGSTYGFGPHNVVFLPPGTMHGFELSGQVNGHAVFFPDSGEGELPDVPLHLRPREPAAHTEISQLIDNLQREIERAGPGEQRALAHHAGLLGVWLERQAAGQPERVLADTAARRLAPHGRRSSAPHCSSPRRAR